MPDIDLDAIEARANAATAGPWCTDDWEIFQGTEYEPGISLWIGETCRGTSDLEQDRADATFVAHARTDVPALVAEVRRLRAELASDRAEPRDTSVFTAPAVVATLVTAGAENRAAALREAANYVRGVSADRRFDKASVSTALCIVSDELRRMAAEAQQPKDAR